MSLEHSSAFDCSEWEFWS